MHIAILHNSDFHHIPEGLARASQEGVVSCAAAVTQALTRRGARVQVSAVAFDPSSFAPQFVKERPDVVFNLCESLGGDARGEMVVPALLDLMRVPYTGSGPLALGLALQKPKSKQLLASAGVPTPRFAVVEKPEDVAKVALPFPLIVKPAREDASIGIDRNSVVKNARELAEACERVLLTHEQPALVEEYVEGREIYVAMVGEPPEPLPLTEIDFSGLDKSHPRILTYECKWDEASPEFKLTMSRPCDLSPVLRARVVDAARRAFRTLEVRDYGRVDVRLSADGTPYVIDVNPNCDLSPSAGFARAAAAAGLAYDDLVWRLVELARNRRHENQADAAVRPAAARGAARKDRGVHAGRGAVRTRAHRSGTREA